MPPCRYPMACKEASIINLCPAQAEPPRPKAPSLAPQVCSRAVSHLHTSLRYFQFLLCNQLLYFERSSCKGYRKPAIDQSSVPKARLPSYDRGWVKTTIGSQMASVSLTCLAFLGDGNNGYADTPANETNGVLFPSLASGRHICGRRQPPPLRSIRELKFGNASGPCSSMKHATCLAA